MHSIYLGRLHKYITAVVQNDNHKMLSINGMPDHIHIFLGLNPVIAISDLVKDIKLASNNCPPERNGQGSMIKDLLKGNLNGSLDMVHFLTENHKLNKYANTS